MNEKLHYLRDVRPEQDGIYKIFFHHLQNISFLFVELIWFNYISSTI